MSDAAELRERLAKERARGASIGFVPTMGWLHEGHLSLVRAAQERCRFTVLSVFVNPTQFGPREDFDSYPRDLERDARLAAGQGVDLLFAPEPAGVYPPGFRTWVEVEGISGRLCGRSRPGHFRGVATVVARLLGLVRPDLIVLGRKDFQQLAVLRRMVRDLDLGVEVVAHPIVRESDGLAMSSRNRYLSQAERRAATVLWRALEDARAAWEGGERDPARLAAALAGTLAREPLAEVEYAEVVDPEELEPAVAGAGRVVCVLAVRIGRTRLIDNLELPVVEGQRGRPC